MSVYNAQRLRAATDNELSLLMLQIALDVTSLPLNVRQILAEAAHRLEKKP